MALVYLLALVKTVKNEKYGWTKCKYTLKEKFNESADKTLQIAVSLLDLVIFLTPLDCQRSRNGTESTSLAGLIIANLICSDQ